jgi:uncharacterized membrane protein YvbJ
MVAFVGFCSKCGNSLHEDAYFCPRCGVRTQAGVSTPSDEIRETLARMGKEMEKAFTIAAQEVQEAFRTARENIRQTAGKEEAKCPNCGEKSASDDEYCGKCGKKLDDP